MLRAPLLSIYDHVPTLMPGYEDMNIFFIPSIDLEPEGLYFRECLCFSQNKYSLFYMSLFFLFFLRRWNGKKGELQKPSFASNPLYCASSATFCITQNSFHAPHLVREKLVSSIPQNLCYGNENLLTFLKL